MWTTSLYSSQTSQQKIDVIPLTDLLHLREVLRGSAQYYERAERVDDVGLFRDRRTLPWYDD